MLIIFYGTSCVGKTTLMRYLRDNYGWKIISTYMTRERRKGESEKKTVPKEELEEGAQNGRFLPLNECYGNYYGTPIDELKHAVEAVDEYWCLDFLIEKKDVLDNFPHCSIVIQPESIDQLKYQIFKANRMERQNEILFENKNYYSDAMVGHFDKVTNHTDDLKRTCEEILKIAQRYKKLIGEKNECIIEYRYKKRIG